jgi:accessory gene regulator protein AgrB
MAKLKVSYLTLVVVAPFLFAPIYINYFFYALAWMAVGLILLLKYMPLRVYGTD